MDSDCSFHLTNKNSWYFTFKESNNAILIDDNTHFKVAGIGTIRIRMSDEAMRTLSDVKYVPDMKKNLIFLGTLDKNGYKYSSKGGVMKVSKGGLVIMKEKIIGYNLYVL